MNFESTEEMVDGVVSSVLGGIGRNGGVASANHTSGVTFWDDPGFLNTRYLKENHTSSSMNPSQSQSLTRNQKLTQSQGLSLGLSILTQNSLESLGQGYGLNQGQMINQMGIMNLNQMNTNVSQMGQSQIQPLIPSQINLSQLSLKSYQPHNRSYSRNNSEPSIPSRMNINAPSYIPSYAKEEGGGDDLHEKYQRLKVELIMKDQIIKNLTDQISLATKTRSSERNELTSNSNQTMKVPQNHYELFEDLSQNLQEKTEELEDTKARLEAWVVGSNISGVTTPQGRLDPQELAHKMILKLKTLQEENEALLKMMSLSNKVSLMVEVGMLRQQGQVDKQA